VEAAWKQRLSRRPLCRAQREGNRAAIQQPLDKEKRKGTFVCAGCPQLPLFSSSAKLRAAAPAGAKFSSSPWRMRWSRET